PRRESVIASSPFSNGRSFCPVRETTQERGFPSGPGVPGDCAGKRFDGCAPGLLACADPRGSVCAAERRSIIPAGSSSPNSDGGSSDAIATGGGATMTGGGCSTGCATGCATGVGLFAGAGFPRTVAALVDAGAAAGGLGTDAPCAAIVGAVLNSSPMTASTSAPNPKGALAAAASGGSPRDCLILASYWPCLRSRSAALCWACISAFTTSASEDASYTTLRVAMITPSRNRCVKIGGFCAPESSV